MLCQSLPAGPQASLGEVVPIGQGQFSGGRCSYEPLAAQTCSVQVFNLPSDGDLGSAPRALYIKGTVCFLEVPEACQLTRRELEHASEDETGLWDSGLGSNSGSLDNYLMPAKHHFHHLEE